MRHAVSALLPPLCIAVIALLVANLLVSFENGRFIRDIARIAGTAQTISMTTPDSTTLSTSWCYKQEREPPQADLHTTVTVTTARNPGETPAEHLTRHLARVATQQETTPDNCSEH